MAESVRHIGTPIAYAFAPRIVSESRRNVDVRAAASHTFIRQTREVRFPADPRPEATVERVIPDIQLVDEGRIGGRDEVDGVVRDVDDVLVGADRIEAWHLEVRQLVRLHLQAETGVG